MSTRKIQFKKYEVNLIVLNPTEIGLTIQNQPYPLSNPLELKVPIDADNGAIKFNWEEATYTSPLAMNPTFKEEYHLFGKRKQAFSELERVAQEPIKKALDNNDLPVELKVKFQYDDGLCYGGYQPKRGGKSNPSACRRHSPGLD